MRSITPRKQSRSATTFLQLEITWPMPVISTRNKVLNHGHLQQNAGILQRISQRRINFLTKPAHMSGFCFSSLGPPRLLKSRGRGSLFSCLRSRISYFFYLNLFCFYYFFLILIFFNIHTPTC